MPDTTFTFAPPDAACRETLELSFGEVACRVFGPHRRHGPYVEHRGKLAGHEHANDVIWRIVDPLVLCGLSFAHRPHRFPTGRGRAFDCPGNPCRCWQPSDDV